MLNKLNSYQGGRSAVSVLRNFTIVINKKKMLNILSETSQGLGLKLNKDKILSVFIPWECKKKRQILIENVYTCICFLHFASFTLKLKLKTEKLS